MNNYLQNLISDIPSENTTLLTALLSGEDYDSWVSNKHMIICHVPFLTLEMAVNRVVNRQRDFTPDPKTIRLALNYAHEKKLQMTTRAKNDAAYSTTMPNFAVNQN